MECQKLWVCVGFVCVCCSTFVSNGVGKYFVTESCVCSDLALVILEI